MPSLPKRLRKLFLKLRALFFSSYIDKDMVVIRFDGGISSQLAFWGLYKAFDDGRTKVKADLSWFRDDGLDMNGDHVRNFDLLKAFPSLEIEIATDLEVYVYQRSYSVSEDAFSFGLVGPAYLGGYYDRWPLFKKYAPELKGKFEPDFSGMPELSSILDALKASEHCCAVHVRRGDLAVFNPYYGEPLTPEYFIQAVAMISEAHPRANFLFFSDEPSWAQENIISAIESEYSCQIVDVNDSSRGYLDLYFMSRCDSFIASQGSLAKYARLLGDPSRMIIEPSSARLFDDSDTHPSRLI